MVTKWHIAKKVFLFIWMAIYLSIGSKDLIHKGRKFQFLNISGSWCGYFLWRTLMTIAKREMVTKGRTPMYKATGPAMDSPKMYKGMIKNIIAM